MLTDKDIQDAVENCFWRKDVQGVWVCSGDIVPCLKHTDDGRCIMLQELFAEERNEPKDEPQTYVINPQEPTNDDKCFERDDFFTCDGQCDEVEDEPQTHTVDLGNGFSITANDCDTCKHRDKPFDDLPCDMCCKAHSGYEPKDEPQTDCPWK